MKITKTGKLPEEQIYVGTCGYCGTEMEAKRGELKHSSWRNEDNYTAECMICDRTVSFDLKKIPPERI